jgi:hypothetical protein
MSTRVWELASWGADQTSNLMPTWASRSETQDLLGTALIQQRQRPHLLLQPEPALLQRGELRDRLAQAGVLGPAWLRSSLGAGLPATAGLAKLAWWLVLSPSPLQGLPLLPSARMFWLDWLQMRAR